MVIDDPHIIAAISCVLGDLIVALLRLSMDATEWQSRKKR
jgi:hypothetical protein